MSNILQELKLQRPGKDPIFKQLGIVSGFKPKELRKSMILLIGPTGCGKSTVVASMGPRTFIFDFDKAHQDVPCSRASRVTPGVMINPETGEETICDAWEHFVLCMEWLKNGGRELYDTVVFDTVDQWIRLVDSALVAIVNKKRETAGAEDQKDLLQSIVDLGQGGYKRLLDRLVIEWTSLSEKGYGLVFTGHLKRRKVKFAETGVERDVPCLGVYPSIEDALRRAADYVIKCIRGQEAIKTTTAQVHPRTGKKMGDITTTTQQRVVKLIFDERFENSELSTMETVKNRVEMPSEILIPEAERHEAYEIISAAHEKACIVQAEKHKVHLSKIGESE